MGGLVIFELKMDHKVRIISIVWFQNVFIIEIKPIEIYTEKTESKNVITSYDWMLTISRLDSYNN